MKLYNIDGNEVSFTHPHSWDTKVKSKLGEFVCQNCWQHAIEGDVIEIHSKPNNPESLRAHGFVTISREVKGETRPGVTKQAGAILSVLKVRPIDTEPVWNSEHECYVQRCKIVGYLVHDRVVRERIGYYSTPSS